ncbi:hypothetical protein [Rickettsia endosymbiont of Polydrusus tereticollis]|uniref:hypothetical protein n=1 Tax=Rickettsia endosymbiont of Polydrusus tereticollis TaxID=3066251 RepID=UPI003132B256
MKFKSKIILLLVLFFLSNCMNFKVPEKTLNAVLNNEKAIIIFNSEIATYPYYSFAFAHTGWSRSNNLKKIETFELSKNNSQYVDYRLWVLEPGEYTLQKVAFYGISADEQFGIVSTLYTPNLLKFSVKAGEVIYLGNIIFYRYENEIIYQIIDDYDEAYAVVKSTYPVLQYRLTKKLIRNEYPEKIRSVSEEFKDFISKLPK